MKKICVLGSLNVDMTVSVPYFNQPGESLTGTGLGVYTGGKGGNQAVAAARLGADVTMIGCLGGDGNGELYRETLKREGVCADGVATASDAPSGLAFIEVVPSGENRIAVVRGANDCLNAAQVQAMEGLIAGSGVLLCQLENPLDAILTGLKLARKHGLITILDPAPAQPLDDEMLALCDWLTPNETELGILTGMPVETQEQAVAAARTLIARGARTVLNKRGAAGALLVTATDCMSVPGFTVKAVDTTAAGDSFNAGLAVGLAEGLDAAAAIRLANAVGALSTTRAGAQPAMPCREEAERLVQNA